MRRQEGWMRRVECMRERRRWVSVCAVGEGGAPGRWAGEQPVWRTRFGTRRARVGISSVSSSSSVRGGGR